MQSIFETSNGISPVSQDFIWVAEYTDNNYLSEFNFTDDKENSFYSIDRDRLLRFGLIGHELKLYFELDGIFNLNGTAIEVAYKVGDKTYPLTGHFGKYGDIITYKDAESAMDVMGRVSTKINQFNFGYKTNLSMDDIHFAFKAICKIPFHSPIHVNFWLVADKDLDGTLVIRKNNKVVKEIEAPLRKHVGGEVNFIV